MKKTVIGLLTLTLSSHALAWTPATYSVKTNKELAIRLNQEGKIDIAHSTEYSKGLMSKKVSQGHYQINAKNFIKGVPYNKITITCSSNTEKPNNKQRVACYKKKGKPIIEILVSNQVGKVDGDTTVRLSW